MRGYINDKGRTRQIGIKLDDALYELIRQLAEEDDRSMGAMARRLIIAGIEARANKQGDPT